MFWYSIKTRFNLISQSGIEEFLLETCVMDIIILMKMKFIILKIEFFEAIQKFCPKIL